MSDNDRPRRYRWVIVGILLAAAVLGWALAGHHRRARLQEQEARIAAELAAQGWTEAVERKDGEIAALAGELARALEDAGAKPAIVVRTRTKRVEVQIPTTCPPPVVVAAAPAEPTATDPLPPPAPDSTAAPNTSLIGVRARNDLVAGLSPGGGLFFQGRQWVTLDGDQWTREVELPVESTEAAISSELRERLDPAPWPRWALRAGVHSDRGYVVGASAYPWRGRVLRRLGAWGAVETGRVERWRPSYDDWVSGTDWRAAGGVEVRW